MRKDDVLFLLDVDSVEIDADEIYIRRRPIMDSEEEICLAMSEKEVGVTGWGGSWRGQTFYAETIGEVLDELTGGGEKWPAGGRFKLAVTKNGSIRIA